MFRRSVVAAAATSLAAGALALVNAAPASAHFSAQLYGASPVAGKSVTVWLRAGHGCSGAATTAVTVKIPANVPSARPQNKPGWALDIAKDASGKVTMVTWSGGNVPDAAFEDFGLSVRLPEKVGETVAFDTVQRCGATEVAWVGADQEAEHPAPTLVTVASPVRATADFSVVKNAKGNVRVDADASAVHAGKLATLRVQESQAVVARVRLDKAGDVGWTATGATAAKVKRNDVVELVVGGQVLATDKA
ncbi:YcnI family protein [Motilibacter aurantiacus]|uniref:YcnI family protein n=1 Tax=Motilibacter aurantiacus TaxID=2714955 RepID=UPI0014080EFA|nr:YcnI family protein [Motilibacter aurantiacus]NHC45809.1 YcnI family protein [Motilibacter aurantiacus]